MRETWKELALEEKEGRGLGATAKGRFEIRLGGVSCLFRKEIKPYEKFEVWTRILAWDQKWLYVICHFVKPGGVKPKRYTLQPWRRGKQQQEKDHSAENGHGSASGNANPKTPSPPHPAIFAAAIAKYVFKKGRLTIPPERVLHASKLLPPKPADNPDSDPSPTLAAATSPPTPSSNTTPAPDTTPAQPTSPDQNADNIIAQSLQAAPLELNINDENENGDGEEWTWERVEKERKRGLSIAGMWTSFDEGLSGEFGEERGSVLGVY